MQTVAIVGVGLIGASFGLALRKAGFEGTIIGVSSEPALQAAKAVGAIDTAAAFDAACSTADLIYLSQTVDRIVGTLQKLAAIVGPGTLVTDAGSTKTAIVREAARSLRHTTFVGGHPMAGKEIRGASAADPDLFQGRPYVLTPVQGPETPHLALFREYLRRMGARIVEMTAEQHDEATAFTSHLPQLISTTLAYTLDQRQNAAYENVHGQGLLDMTRLALSSPDLWASILESNQENVLNALDIFIQQLGSVREAVRSHKIEAHFAGGESFARKLRQ